MHHLFDPTSVPKLISLPINKDLLSKAKKLNIDLAKELEKIIIHELEVSAKKEWTESNLSILQSLSDGV